MKILIVRNLQENFLAFVQPSLKKFKDVLLYLTANVVGAGLSYLTLPFFTNRLLPEDFGVWGYVLMANSFLSPIIALDLHSYYLVEYYKLPDEKKGSLLFNTLISFSFVWALCFLLICLLAGGLVFALFHISIPFHPYMSITLLSNLTSVFFLFLLIQYRLERKSFGYAFLTVFQTILSFSISILMILAYKSNVLSRITGYTIGQTILGIYCFIILKKKYNFRFSIQKDIIKKALWFASPLIPYSLAFFLFDFLDRFFLEKCVKDLAELGYYSLAFQFTSLLSVFFIAVLRLFEPDIMKWINKGEQSKFSKFFNGYLLLVSVVSISFALLGPPILSFMTNPRFEAAGIISVHLISAFYFKSILLLLFTLLITYSKTRFQMLLMIGAVLAFGVLGNMITATYKTSGLIILKTGIYAIMCVVSFMYVQKFIQLRQSMVFTLCLGALIILYCNFYR